jgi:ABC-type uncharacterized transport system permease subunit
MDLALTVIVPVVVTALALVVGLGLIAATGASVPRTVSAFWVGAFGSNYAIGASLNRAVPFALVGVGFILAARGNLTNVGGEGQIAVGGILATATALQAPAIFRRSWLWQRRCWPAASPGRSGAVLRGGCRSGAAPMRSSVPCCSASSP